MRWLERSNTIVAAMKETSGRTEERGRKSWKGSDAVLQENSKALVIATCSFYHADPCLITLPDTGESELDGSREQRVHVVRVYSPSKM